MKSLKQNRIAVIDFDKCQPEQCNWMCIRVCPVNKMGQDCIVQGEGKPVLSEVMCTGCGICPHKCPFGAISIINLSAELSQPLHQFSKNGFRMYKMPYPKEGSVVGLIGRNGIGKTTVLRILSKDLIPNLGNLGQEPSIEKLVEFFKGKELMNFFQKLKDSEIRVSLKPQAVDLLPQKVKGRVSDLLKKVDERGKFKELVKEFELEKILESELSKVSGGELQRIAICAAMLKKADYYFFDEPSSYLDIRQRLRTAKLIASLALEGKTVIVIEHDLAVLDYLSDYVHVMYGAPGVYGVVSGVKSVRNGINEFLEGFLKDENVRFRGKELKFEVKPFTESTKKKTLVEFPALKKSFSSFSLETEAGELKRGEVLGIAGPNAIGKTTFVKMLAGIEKPDNSVSALKLKVSFKPQYLVPEPGLTVQELFAREKIDKDLFNSEVDRRLKASEFNEARLEDLSGGELQRVSVALCLCRKADLFLLDEPSAFIDVEDRLKAADAIRAVVEKTASTAMVVEHDLLFLDYLSDRLIVFDGTPSLKGFAFAPVSMHEGMNSFLKKMDVSFRRDPQTGRPRANKLDSVKDRDQKKLGEFYYSFQ